MSALIQRMGSMPLWMEDPAVTTRWEELHERLRGELQHQYWAHWYFEGPIVPTPYRDWLKSYNAPQREMLNRGKVTQQQTNLGAKSIRNLKAFVKIELTPMTLEKAFQKRPKARLIQGRSPAVTSGCGPTMHALGKRLMKVWPPDPTGVRQVAYLGGITAEQLGAWYGECVDVGLEPVAFDVTMWETGMGPGPHRSWRADVFALQPKAEVRALLLERELTKVGYTRFGLRYDLDWQVSSGDTDTTVGNSVAHGKMWIEVLRHHPQARVGVGGDNSLLMVHPKERQQVIERAIETFARFGFIIAAESERVGYFSATVFSGRLWVTADGWVFGPKIGRVMTKTFWCIDAPKSHLKRLQHLRAIALGLINNCGHIPILRRVLHNILAHTKGVHAKRHGRFESEEWKNFAERAHGFNPLIYGQMLELYGVSREDVDDAEKLIDSLDCTTPTLVDHPTINRIVAVDLDDEY